MEHKNKSLATATSEAQGACAVSMVDRLSSVPCKVAHRILSLVSFKDLTRVGSLSKRCREYYLSNPSLKLSSLFGNRQRQLNFLNCCDRYMICRRGDKIKSFSIQWDFSAGTSEESFRMMTWILIAVRCNVEVLDLQLRYCSGKVPCMPGTTYLGMHVKSLSDDLVPAMISLLRGMPNLKTLYINSYPSLNVAKPKACGFKKKYWKSQNLDCIHQLEEVSISLSTGYPTNALELAIYILEHAPKLKKMVIYYLRRRQLYIIEKVNKSKKVSSATVIFKEREVDDDEAMGDMYYRQLYRWYW
ncbi:hypothetical protein ACLB2K_044931 [Fragaria x ananassa]